MMSPLHLTYLALEDQRRFQSSMEDTLFVQDEVAPRSESPASADYQPLAGEDPLVNRLNAFWHEGVGCDVVFIVGEEKEKIKSHRLILAASSDVFYAMFFGAYSMLDVVTHDDDAFSEASDFSPSSSTGNNNCEDDFRLPDLYDVVNSVPKSRQTTPIGSRNYVQVINVPDTSPVAFRVMLEYMYNSFDVKRVALNDDNVMLTLYAAKKYNITGLVTACVQYLLNGLTPANAVCLFSQARLFDEKLLMKRCLYYIDTYTNTALAPENITDVDRTTLQEVLRRSELDPSRELVIFNCAKAWAEAECDRLALAPTVENLRNALGPVLQLIRFPLMDVHEFGQAAASALLTCEEISEVFLYLTVQPRPYCRFPTAFRCHSRSKHVVNRFTSLAVKRCTRRENKICFSTDKDILLRGLGVYGIYPVSKHNLSEEQTSTAKWSCSAEIALFLETGLGQPVSMLASNTVYLHGTVGDPTPVDAFFSEAVHCPANVTYVVLLRFTGDNAIQSLQGKDGQESVTVDLPYDNKVTFRFHSFRNAYGNDDGGRSEGQIPALHFYSQWSDDQA